MNLYKVSEQQYGWIFSFLAVAIIAPTQLNRFLLKRFTSEQIIYTTLVYQSVVGVLMVAGTWAGWYGLYGLIGMLFLFLCGQGLTGPNSTALSLAPFVRYAGSAAALMGSFRMGYGAAISAAVSLLHNHTALPMVGVMTLCALSSLVLLLIGQRSMLYRQAQAEVGEPVSEIVL